MDSPRLSWRPIRRRKASSVNKVVDRRRIELIEPGMRSRGVGGGGASVSGRAASAAQDELESAMPQPIASMSLRAWPVDFPEENAVQRRAPHESRADSIMYCQVLAELAQARGWMTHLYNAKDVETEAASILGERADEVLHGPRATLGPPWSKDHRTALAATIVVG